MKKKLFFAILVMAVVTFASVAVVSCKKDNENNKKAENNTEMESAEIDDMDGYLTSFRNKLLSAQKGEEYISLEQAQRDLGNLLNFDFGDAGHSTNMLQHDTLFATLSINQGQIDLSQLGVAYMQLCNGIRETYKNVNLPEKSVYYISCNIAEMGREGNNISVILVTRGHGRENMVTESFTGWRPNSHGGSCEDPTIAWGAPEQMEVLLDGDLAQITYACENGRVYFTDIITSFIEAYQDILYDANAPRHYKLYVSWLDAGNDCVTVAQIQYYHSQASLIRENYRSYFYPSFPSNHEATEHSIIYKPKDDDHSPILPAMWVYGVTHGALNCTGQGPNT